MLIIREKFQILGGDVAAEYAKVNSTLEKIAFAKYESINKAIYWLRISVLNLVGIVIFYGISLII